MPSYSGDYETEYDYEIETDFREIDQGGGRGHCCGQGYYCNEYEYEYGYGIDTDSFYLTRNDVYYGDGDDTMTAAKNVSISKQMSIYIPDLGFTPEYFKDYTREEINTYFVTYLSRVLCSPYHPIVKKIHKVHAKLDNEIDTISCTVYVEWYDNAKTWLLQKDIKDKTQKISIKFEIDGFEWKLQKNYKPVCDFRYEEKLRAEIETFKLLGLGL
jgi:hypothetical protein